MLTRIENPDTHNSATVIGPFIGSHFYMSSYFKAPFYWTTPTNGYSGLFYTAEHAYCASMVTSEHLASDCILHARDDPRLIHRATLRAVKHPQFASMLPLILWEIEMAKFSNLDNQNIASLLLDTSSMPIINFNYWHDNTLGVCMCDRCSGTGLNLRGVVLMMVREELRLNPPDHLQVGRHG